MPDSTQSLHAKALALLTNNKLADASKVYHELLISNPEDAQVLYEYGNLLKRRGEKTQSIKYLESAIEKQPDFSAAHSSLGGAYRLIGLHDQSYLNYRKAVKLDPDNQYIHSNLLMSMLYTDDMDEGEKF